MKAGLLIRVAAAFGLIGLVSGMPMPLRNPEESPVITSSSNGTSSNETLSPECAQAYGFLDLLTDPVVNDRPASMPSLYQHPDLEKFIPAMLFFLEFNKLVITQEVKNIGPSPGPLNMTNAGMRIFLGYLQLVQEAINVGDSAVENVESGFKDSYKEATVGEGLFADGTSVEEEAPVHSIPVFKISTRPRGPDAQKAGQPAEPTQSSAPSQTSSPVEKPKVVWKPQNVVKRDSRPDTVTPNTPHIVTKPLIFWGGGTLSQPQNVTDNINNDNGKQGTAEDMKATGEAAFIAGKTTDQTTDINTKKKEPEGGKTNSNNGEKKKTKKKKPKTKTKKKKKKKKTKEAKGNETGKKISKIIAEPADTATTKDKDKDKDDKLSTIAPTLVGGLAAGAAGAQLLDKGVSAITSARLDLAAEKLPVRIPKTPGYNTPASSLNTPPSTSFGSRTELSILNDAWDNSLPRAPSDLGSEKTDLDGIKQNSRKLPKLNHETLKSAIQDNWQGVQNRWKAQMKAAKMAGQSQWGKTGLQAPPEWRQWDLKHNVPQVANSAPAGAAAGAAAGAGGAAAVGASTPAAAAAGAPAAAAAGAAPAIVGAPANIAGQGANVGGNIAGTGANVAGNLLGTAGQAAGAVGNAVGGAVSGAGNFMKNVMGGMLGGNAATPSHSDKKEERRPSEPKKKEDEKKKGEPEAKPSREPTLPTYDGANDDKEEQRPSESGKKKEEEKPKPKPNPKPNPKPEPKPIIPPYDGAKDKKKEKGAGHKPSRQPILPTFLSAKNSPEKQIASAEIVFGSDIQPITPSRAYISTNEDQPQVDEEESLDHYPEYMKSYDKVVELKDGEPLGPPPYCERKPEFSDAWNPKVWWDDFFHDENVLSERERAACKKYYWKISWKPGSKGH
ncbi:hypothetical protein F5X68DRAFT_195352 [Plectosphaerella plurivora]|uniref:Uncharacterized protein n=1 Tax=Plectosphaerella plurivora TaxID=936078 RepID=A0A9P8V1E2_9PEZI|nr:hypothetical protein F5X68DRAFT_195352 [Plectosphaerella plurivora]